MSSASATSRIVRPAKNRNFTSRAFCESSASSLESASSSQRSFSSRTGAGMSFESSTCWKSPPCFCVCRLRAALDQDATHRFGCCREEMAAAVPRRSARYLLIGRRPREPGRWPVASAPVSLELIATWPAYAVRRRPTATAFPKPRAPRFGSLQDAGHVRHRC